MRYSPTRRKRPIIAQKGDIRILFDSTTYATHAIGRANREVIAFWATHELTRLGWTWSYYKVESINASES
jgi:hypothetical protein